MIADAIKTEIYISYIMSSIRTDIIQCAYSKIIIYIVDTAIWICNLTTLVS